MKLTATRLRQLFDYDPQTGAFTRRVSINNKSRAGMAAGSPDKLGYLTITINYKSYKAHRLAWMYVYGELPNSAIDHINGKPCDNRIANLRLATPSQNLANSAPRRHSASGYKGVTWDARRGHFFARIMVNYKTKYLGTFPTAKAAHAAYRAAAEKHFGAFARTS